MQLDQASLSSRKGLLILSTLCLASSTVGIFPRRIHALDIELHQVEGYIYVALGVFTVLNLISFESRISAQIRSTKGDSSMGLGFYFSEIFLPKIIATISLLALLFVNPSKSPFYSAWEPFGEAVKIIISHVQADLGILFIEYPVRALVSLLLITALLFWRNELGPFWYVTLALSIFALLDLTDFRRIKYIWRNELGQEWAVALFPSPTDILLSMSILISLLIICMYAFYRSKDVRGKTPEDPNGRPKNILPGSGSAIECSRLEKIVRSCASDDYLISSEVLASDDQEAVMALRFDISAKQAEPTTDGCRHKELSFVITGAQNSEGLPRIVQELSGGSLRRLFLVLVREDEVKECSKRGQWRVRALEGTITDQSLHKGIHVRSLLEASNNDWFRHLDSARIAATGKERDEPRSTNTETQNQPLHRTLHAS